MTEPAEGASQLEELCQHLSSIGLAVKNLQEGLVQLENRMLTLASPSTPATSPSSPHFSSSQESSVRPTVVMLPPEPRVPTPDRFSGDRSKFRAFRNACQLYFLLQPRTFSLESTKVGFVISLLQGEPQSWAHRLPEQENDTLSSLSKFFEAMAVLYDDPQRTATAEAALHVLQQGRRPVEEYVTDFRRWSADTTWNDSALRHQFRMGLSEALKDELARVGVPEDLKGLIRLAIQIDRRLRERRAERSSGISRPVWVMPRVPLPPSHVPMGDNAPAPDVPEPMQVGLLRPSLTYQERTRRQQLDLCLYCGEAGHYVRRCPNKFRKSRATPLVHHLSMSAKSTHPALSISLQLPGKTLPVTAIIDSGACSCFVDLTFASQHGIPLQNKAQSLSLHLADGSHIKSGPVTQESIPIPVLISPGHRELLRLDVIASPLFPVILGIPWLRAHNPHIDWATGKVRFTSEYCRHHCLPQPSSPLLGLSTEEETCPIIPQAYHNFIDVFSKQGAETLPPHRSYDCPIELLPGAEIPFGRIYPLSEPELKVLKGYVEENLQKGFIRPSTSPAGAGIFFVEKKDGSLRPCVDYRDLNKVTVKNRYPLPLVPELFQRLRGATIFTKLDLRGAYNLVHIREGDEWKTAFRTRFGHFEYLVMPFGLCNAPATFQHLVNEIFRDMLDLSVIVYLDDILVFSSSLELHRVHVKQVLSRLRQHGLYAKPEKCEFEKSRIQFLGLIISTQGVEMDPQKVAAILDWPAPEDKKGIQRFIGFANFYRRFIKGFSTIIAPITLLTRQSHRFSWNSEAQAAFDKLKALFTTAPILRHPDPSLPYVLEVDASEVAVGAILSQRQGPKSLLHPVVFFSRKLNSAEKNYDV